MEGSLSARTLDAAASSSNSPGGRIEEALSNPPSSPSVGPAPAVANQANGPAETLNPQVQSFLKAFVARAVLDSPQAKRAEEGRRRFYPDATDAQWYDWKWQF